MDVFFTSSLTHEHQDCSGPLHVRHNVAKEQHGAQDGEELARRGDDGAGQGSKVHHGHEDEGLKEEGEDSVMLLQQEQKPDKCDEWS